jgi:hypothetical protein
MVRNGQLARSVTEALGISENLIHQWKRAAKANQSSAEPGYGINSAPNSPLL